MADESIFLCRRCACFTRRVGRRLRPLSFGAHWVCAACVAVLDAKADAIRAAQTETPPGKGGVSVNAVSSEETPQ